MNILQKLYYKIFWKNCKFVNDNPNSYYGFFSNGERLHGIILGHNPVRVTNIAESNFGVYKCNDCSKEWNQTWVDEESV